MAARPSARSKVLRQTNSHFFTPEFADPITGWPGQQSIITWTPQHCDHSMNTYTDDDDSDDDNEHSTQTSYTQVNH